MEEIKDTEDAQNNALEPLGAAQQRVWDSVMDTPQSALLTPSSYPVLAAYCSAVVDLDQLRKRMNRGRYSDDQYIKYYKLKMDSERHVSTLAGRLRLIPSSIHNRDTAATKIKNSNYDTEEIFVDM